MIPGLGETAMGLSNSLKKMMKDPKNQERLSQLSKKAQEKAKDPSTRAHLDKALEKAKKMKK
jgi:Sec-independent protein translocase protein TatA